MGEKVETKIKALYAWAISRIFFNEAYFIGSALANIKERLHVKKSYLWPESISELFNERYYLDKYPDVKKYAGPLWKHYIQHGFHEGRSPSPLIDISFICSQIKEQIEIRGGAEMETINVRGILKKYDNLVDLLKRLDLSPNPLFDNEYFRNCNNSEIGDEVPVQFYLRNKGVNPVDGGYLETTPYIAMENYMAQYRDLVEAKVTPLLHLFEWGMREGRLENSSFVSKEFRDNTLGLYGDEIKLDTYDFLMHCIQSNTLASPNWPSKFTEISLPSLSYKSPVEDMAGFIGVVLYRNSKEEIRRLKKSIDKEIESNAKMRIIVRYFLNDSENIELYRDELGDENLIFSPKGNIGFGKAHNHLMEVAFKSCDLYIGLNPDGYVLHGCIKALADFNNFHNGSALIEAVTTPIDHPKWHDPITLETYWVSGAAFAISNKIWEKTGGFDPNIHMYCEDVDLSWRAKAAGFQLKVCPTARFFHDVTPRFIEVSENKERQRSRTIHMLSGAYYLAQKWSGYSQAKSIRAKLLDLGVDTRDELFSKKIEPYCKKTNSVSNFNFWLRYAPSRFW